MMTGPAKNRLHDYEAGWLTLLVQMGAASEKQADDAMCRVAQAAIAEVNERRERQQEHGRNPRHNNGEEPLPVVMEGPPLLRG
jgi:hypothetical protein